MEQWIEVLSNFGFPIACCAILMWYVFHLQKQHKEELDIIINQHKEEADKMTSAINANTIVMQKLVDKLGE